MSTLKKVEQLLSEMTRAEKVRLLQLIAHDLSDDVPGIERASDVCGGDPRIAGTRIPVWVLVQYKNLGADEADLLRAYPTLRAEDLANAWSYYRMHKEEIEEQIVENEAD
ncbi:MAG: DUF433 domain-containing protein [Blastocatellia bacterium]|nr:DUF433 domain-containing protein [Blastocatellia bacterium]